MYRLLIVDDEPTIVNGLVQIFQENTEFELDICKAYSSKEALAIAMTTKLDILVCDIRMPQKNGLQLVDEIAYYWPLCRIIFLTGYSEFEYVYEALRKKVDNYILKTEGIEPIFQAVKVAISKLEEENNLRRQQERVQMQFQIAEPFLKNELLERVFNGVSMNSLRCEPRYEEVDIRISIDQPAFFLIGQVNRLEGHKSKINLQTVQRIFDNYLPPSIVCEKVIYPDDVLVWLLQPGEELMSRFQEGRGIVVYMRGILELVQNECEELLRVSVSFGMSRNLMNNWDTIRLQYKSLHSMIQNMASLGQNMVIVDIEKTSAHEEPLYEGGRIQQDDGNTLVIEKIRRYVDKNLSGDVSLTAIAEEVHFNPSYLSRYYKQMTGHNLLEYIQTKKLDGAIHLMENTTLRLNEIAIRVGFDSHSYFTTFFKKKMGLSPQEYRNK